MNANTALSSTLARWRAWPWFADALKRLRALFATLRAEAELRALDDLGLRDLGLDRGGIAYAARHGRYED
ncbi:MAG: hypothetical protein IPG66_08235 [Hydrogenophilales bacterium]|nr:hypothetical protein [Hydrogenophilales bacterium]